MNCDRAFDLITSPSERNDSELQHHLQGCPRCRDLVEMFAPALHLLEEAGPGVAFGPDGEMLYWSSDRLDDQAPEQPQTRRGSSRYDCPEYWQAVEAQQRRRGYQEGLKVAGFLSLIALFSVGLAIIGRDNATPLAQVAAIATETCLRRDTDGKDSAPALAACIACHLDETENSKLTDDANIRVRALVQRCVTCHLELKRPGTEIADLGNSANNDDEIWGHSAGPCLRLASGG